MPDNTKFSKSTLPPAMSPEQPFRPSRRPGESSKFLLWRHEGNTTKTGGDDRVRTDNPCLAKAVLSQLSYIPTEFCMRLRPRSFPGGLLEAWRFSERALLVGLGRVELPTSSLSGTRSNQLSYKPLYFSCSSVLLSPTVRYRAFVIERRKTVI